MTARILNVSPDEYHLLPGLSQSTAATLILKSPRHAWHEHPAYGAAKRKATRAMDIGTVVHSIRLGKGKQFAPVPFDDYKTKASRQTRDSMRAAGMVPVLHHELERAERIAAVLEKELIREGLALDGESEVAIEWYEPSTSGPVLCRGMMDHVHIDRGRIIDLKIVANAGRKAIERSAESFGYGIQWAAYTRALIQLRPDLAGRTEFWFVFCENDEPFVINPCQPDGLFRELGERRWRRAVETWAYWLARDPSGATWPGYATRYISASSWALEEEERHADVR